MRRSSRLWRSGVLAAGLAVCLVLGAAALTAQNFTESTQVVVVEVPVQVVRDGEPVKGLTAADFEVFDGRKKVPITGFEVLDLTTTTAARPRRGRSRRRSRRGATSWCCSTCTSPIPRRSSRRARPRRTWSRRSIRPTWWRWRPTATRGRRSPSASPPTAARSRRPSRPWACPRWPTAPPIRCASSVADAEAAMTPPGEGPRKDKSSKQEAAWRPWRSSTASRSGPTPRNRRPGSPPSRSRSRRSPG